VFGFDHHAKTAGKNEKLEEMKLAFGDGGGGEMQSKKGGISDSDFDETTKIKKD